MKNDVFIQFFKIKKDYHLEINFKINLSKAKQKQFYDDFKGEMNFLDVFENKKIPNKLMFNWRFSKKELKKSNLDIYEKLFDYFSGITKKAIEVDFFSRFQLDDENLVTNPPLPSTIEASETNLGQTVVSGLKLHFNKPKSSLRIVNIDVTPCIDCGTTHKKINMVTREKIKLSKQDMMRCIEKAHKYLTYFYNKK